MKRLRSLSIKDPDELDRLNRKRAWGQMYWRNVNLRKRREFDLRRVRHMHFLYIVPADSLPGEAVDAGGCAPPIIAGPRLH